MINLELDIDEAIVLQAENVGRYVGDEEYQLDEMYLTNKSIVLVSEENEIDTFSLGDIKIINDKVLVKKMYTDEHGLCMQIQFLDSVEYFVFENKTKTATPEWVEKITEQRLAFISIHQTGEQLNSTSNKNSIKCTCCGEGVLAEAKFCSCCGAVVGENSPQEENASQRKMVYEGEIHKCPQCGDVLKSFELHCPTCGYEIRGNKASSNIEAFADELQRLEAVGGKGKKQRIINHIRTFPIPTNKEDLYEFMILAASNIREDRYDDETSQTKKDISDAWKAKLEQAYQKAKISFSKSENFEEMKELYLQKIKEQKQAKARNMLKCVGIFLGIALLSVIFPLIFGIENSVDRSKIQKENERLEVIVSQVYEHIEDEEYALARSKASSLVFSGSTTSDGEQAATKWDTTRRELLDIIDKAEYGDDYVPTTREIKIGVSQDELKDEDYQDVKKQFKKRGFTNIKTEEINDLTTGWWKSEGSVEKVSIGGETVFSEDTTYSSDVEIIIYYHALKEKRDKELSDESTENDNKLSNGFEEGTYELTNVKNFTFAIPNYWEEEGSKNEYLQYYAEKGEKVVMLSIAYPKETDNKYDVSFEGLYADNENMVEAVGAMFTDGDVVEHEIFESNYGVKGILYRFTYNQKVNWLTKVDGSGYCFCFPSEDDRRWFYVVLLHTNNVASDDYKDDYMKLISDIKENHN